MLLGRHLGCAPESIEISAGRYGKPFLPKHPKLFFNLSHAEEIAVYAFSTADEVGVDVEYIRPELAGLDIAERYFSETEKRELRALPREAQAEAFFLCWTRKEAYVKAHGDGLQIPLDSFDVSLTSVDATIRSVDSARWRLWSFCPMAGYVASVVTGADTVNLKFWAAPNAVS